MLKCWSSLDTIPLLTLSFLEENIKLPQSVTTFEWYNRNEKSFPELLPKLQKLKNLEYLYLGHSNLFASWADFFDIISHDNMPNLQYLMFRFCRFFKDIPDNNDFSWINVTPECLKKVQFMKFDLCYGYLPRIMDSMLGMTTENLKIISLTIISDETTKIFSELFTYVSEQLKYRKISLHLGLLQKTDQLAFKKKIQQWVWLFLCLKPYMGLENRRFCVWIVQFSRKMTKYSGFFKFKFSVFWAYSTSNQQFLMYLS